MKFRLLVEIEWFIYLSNVLKLKGTRVWKPVELKELRSVYEYFDLIDAGRVKAIEKVTNHDVNAIEYLIKEKLKDSVFEPYLEFVHFACTSEDINNLSYAMMLKGGVDKLVPVLTGVVEYLYELAKKNKKVITTTSLAMTQVNTPQTLVCTKKPQ